MNQMTPIILAGIILLAAPPVAGFLFNQTAWLNPDCSGTPFDADNEQNITQMTATSYCKSGVSDNAKAPFSSVKFTLNANCTLYTNVKYATSDCSGTAGDDGCW